MKERRPLNVSIQEVKKKNNPWRPVVLYAIFGFLWILFSDRLLGILVKDADYYAQIQTYKGWLFVGVTTLLLYGVIVLDNRKVFRLNKEIRQKNSEVVAFGQATKAMEEALQLQVKQLDQLVHHDGLTGLNNRLVFEQDLESMIQSGKDFAIYYIDIDQFKNINDIHGHHIGDQLLTEFAQVLERKFKRDHLYRWGGDEFLIIDDQNTGELLIEEVEAMLELTHRSWHLDNIVVETTTSMGVIQCPEHGSDINTIFKHLEIALYKAKANGRARSEFYVPSFKEEIERKSNVQKAIDVALISDGFYLNYQPIYDLKTRQLHRLEVLLRFKNTDQLNTNIGEVISVAEETGQIHKIDDWVIETVLSTLKEQALEIPGVKFAINISAQTFTSKRLIDNLKNLIEAYEVDTSMVELEITEHTIVHNIHESHEIMKRLKALGFMIALDDFGTRYSSLNYLSRLPFDVLKIDKSYVDYILNKGKDPIIVEQIITLSKKLGLITVAEGIELKEQEATLKLFGCDYGQGYYYSRPQTYERMVEIFGTES